MTENEILDGVLVREGGYTNDPKDAGGPTKYGITAATLGSWRNLGRSATAAEVEALSANEAKAIYAERYINGPRFTPGAIRYEPLRVQLIDFGVNSGPERAIRWLQRLLKEVWVGVRVSGRLDSETLAALEHAAFYLPLVNNALVAARSYMIDASTDAGTVNKKFEEGLESRALVFFTAKPN